MYLWHHHHHHRLAHCPALPPSHHCPVIQFQQMINYTLPGPLQLPSRLLILAFSPLASSSPIQTDTHSHNPIETFRSTLLALNVLGFCLIVHRHTKSIFFVHKKNLKNKFLPLVFLHSKIDHSALCICFHLSIFIFIFSSRSKPNRNSNIH